MTAFEKFHTTDREYSTVPFWFWNYRMDKNEITRQLELMVDQHIYECVIHARYGLITPYLSEEWFDCIGHAITEGKRLGMRFWLYDENNWPSGYAGGRVLEVNPDFNEKHIKMLSCKPGEEPNLDRVIRIEAVFEQKPDKAWVRNDHASTDVPRRFFALYNTRWKVAYGQDYYIDLLNPAATKAFIRITHEEYLHRFGDDMGTTIRGFFSDEAGFYNGLQLPWSDREDDGSLVWTPGFSEAFKARCGYDICDNLPELFTWDADRSPKVRTDFQNTACSLYRENFLRLQRDFCEAHGIKLIGHLHYEDYLHLHVATQGDFLKALSEFSYAGCDRIEYWTGAISERLTASVGRQFDKPRVLSESFARGGWDFTMQDMRRWTDFQLVRGINLFVIHAFFYSIEEFRRNDAPPSFFYQSPAYPYFHYYSDYVMRMCRLLSQGTPVNSLGVYFPTAAGQVMFDVWDREPVRSLDRDVQEVVRALEEAQYDCCLLHEDTLTGATPQNGSFTVGKENITALAVLTRWLPFDVFESLYRMAKQGMPVAFLRHRPQCIEADKREQFEQLLDEILELDSVAYINEYYFYREFTFRFDYRHLDMAKGFLKAAKPPVTLRTVDTSIKCCARKTDGMTAYFLVNENSGIAENTVYFSENTTPVIWDALDGSRRPCTCTVENGRVAMPMKLEPYASQLVVFGDEDIPSAVSEREIERKNLDGDWFVTIGEKSFSSQAVRLETAEYGKIEKITYEYEITLENPGDIAELEIHSVHNICEVSVNGESAGVILWKPNRIRCDLFVKGKNNLCITVYATPAGVLGEESLPFGIEGPVTLSIMQKTQEVL